MAEKSMIHFMTLLLCVWIEKSLISVLVFLCLILSITEDFLQSDSMFTSGSADGEKGFPLILGKYSKLNARTGA
jgi:hypothetical protein